MRQQLIAPFKCSACPLRGAKHVRNKVRTYLYAEAPIDVLVVTEAPGKAEDEKGEPMVGAGGTIMRRLLKEAGITSYAMGNVVRCLPDEKTREPRPDEVAACLPHLLRDIETLKPKVILLTGRLPAQALLKSTATLSKLRGWQTLRTPQATYPVFVTSNPASVHYNPATKGSIETDLVHVKRKLSGNTTSPTSYTLHYLDTLDALDDAVMETLQQTGVVGFDWECADLSIVGAHPYCLNWGWQGKKGATVYGVPLRHPNTPWSGADYPAVIKLLRLLFKKLSTRAQEGAVTLTAHNAKFDSSIHADVLKVKLPCVLDTMQLAHAVDENRSKEAGSSQAGFSLETLVQDWLGVKNDFWDDQTSRLLYSGQGDKAGIKKLVDHCARDVAVQTALYDVVQQKIKQQKLDLTRIQPLFASLPYLISSMERTGTPLDIDELMKLLSPQGPLVSRQTEVLAELHTFKTVQAAIKRVRGSEKQKSMLFGSADKQKGFAPTKRTYQEALFFDVLKLDWGTEPEQQTKTGQISIDKSFCEHFKNVPEVALYQEWNQINKLVSVYIKGWWAASKKNRDGRIRPSFNSAATVTGRLSGSQPNLQQIPRGDTPSAKLLKKVFRPERGPDRRVILAADLSQAEVRWLAETAREPALQKVYAHRKALLDQYAKTPSKELWERIELEGDLHRQTAAKMFKMALKAVTKKDRSSAKSMVFGLLYGMTEYGLAAQLGISVEEAVKLRELWLAQFPAVRQWIEDIKAHALKYGYVESPLGRRRHLDSLLLDLPEFSGTRQHLLRVATNAPIQSVASDMTLWIAVKLQRYIDEYQKPWQLHMLIHDAIVGSAPLEQALEYADVIKTIGEDPTLLKELGIPKLWVPQELEVEVGLNYGDAIPLRPSRGEQEQVIEQLRKAA